MHTHDEALTPFLSRSLSTSNFKVLPLAGDASNRRYYRVVIDDKSWVLMRWEPFHPEKYPFLSVLNHFAKFNVHVPQVVSMAPEEGLMLLEDLGDLTLERKFWENQNQDNVMYFYEMAIDELIKIHHHSSAQKNDCTAFHLEFDVPKFMWEMNYAKEHLLEGILNIQLNPGTAKEINELFLDICTQLHNEPKKIAHRDYHSRNLMLQLDKMCVIDFQDARLGPIQYDLVSLLRDSYVDMSDETSHKLIDSYLLKSKEFLPSDFSKEQFDHIYEVQTIQRCFKACGSFSSFYNTREDRRYLKYLSGTLLRVLKTLNQFPQYKLFSDLLIDSGALERKFESL